MKRNVVITGATSFIGVHLIREWAKRECTIYAIVRPNSKNLNRLPNETCVQVIELEMVEYQELPKHIKRADVFYHLAWEGARVPYRDNVQIQRNNYDSAVKAMEAAHEMVCSLFIGSGSQAEYGKTASPVEENAPCNPNTAYGKEKLHACETLADMAKQYDMKFIWTRIFSVYGKYDDPGTLIMSSIEKMKRNESIQVTACTQLWDYLYVEDAARAMVKFAEVDCENGIYNVASGNIRPLKEYVEEIRDVIGSESLIEYGAKSYGPDGPIDLQPNNSKVVKSLDWKVETTFAEGIKKCVGEEGCE